MCDLGFAGAAFCRPAAAQTLTTEPTVRACFKNSDEFCKKSCGDDLACFKECTEHCLTAKEMGILKLKSGKQR
jgi:hypothetical protein